MKVESHSAVLFSPPDNQNCDIAQLTPPPRVRTPSSASRPRGIDQRKGEGAHLTAAKSQHVAACAGLGDEEKGDAAVALVAPTLRELRALEPDLCDPVVRTSPDVEVKADFSSYDEIVARQRHRLFEAELLTREQEQELSQQISLGGGAAGEARERFMAANVRLVSMLVRKHYEHMATPALGEEDLVQEGIEGLRRAVDKFDPVKFPDIKFSTYAAWWIREAVGSAAHEKGPTIRLPVHTAHLITKAKKVAEEMNATHNRKARPEDVLKEISSRRGKIKASPAALEAVTRALTDTLPSTIPGHKPLSGDSQGDTIFSLIADEAAPDPTGVDTSVNFEGIMKVVHAAMGCLDKRERGVLELRLPLDPLCEPRSLEAIGHKFGLTRERIRQIERDALLKLRTVLEGRGISFRSLTGE